MVDEPSDEQLLERYRATADGASFAQLYQRYAARILSLFRRSGLPDELCEELLQQTFLHVHRARNDFRAGGRFRPWLFAIAINTRREHFRWRFSRPESPADELPEAPVAPSASSVSDRLMRRALQQLPEEQREVILLHWFEDLPFADVASIVGASVPAVKVRAHRGYERLRQILDLK